MENQHVILKCREKNSFVEEVVPVSNIFSSSFTYQHIHEFHEPESYFFSFGQGWITNKTSVLSFLLSTEAYTTLYSEFFNVRTF